MTIFAVLYDNTMDIRELFNKEKISKDADMKVFDDEQDADNDYYTDAKEKQYT